MTQIIALVILLLMYVWSIGEVIYKHGRMRFWDFYGTTITTLVTWVLFYFIGMYEPKYVTVPMFIVFGLGVFNIVYTFMHHGESANTKYNAFSTLFYVVIDLLLYYWWGVFDCLDKWLN